MQIIEKPPPPRQVVYVDNPSPPPVVVVSRPPPPPLVVFSRPPPPRPPVLVTRPRPPPVVVSRPRAPAVVPRPAPRRPPSLPLVVEPVRLNEPSVPPRVRERGVPRPANVPSSNRAPVSITNPDRSLQLRDVVAQNRARRGTRLSRPRRQIYEEQNRDLPTYRRNIVKNGFMVHK